MHLQKTIMFSCSYILTGVLLASVASAQSIVYDASLGTLPDAQGFTSVTNGNPVLEITAGALHYVSDAGGVAYWEYPVFTGFPEGTRVQLEAKIVVSGYTFVGGCCGRAGLAFFLIDHLGRVYYVGIGEGAVFLSNDRNGNQFVGDVVETFFATTDSFHTYRLDTTADGATLLVDCEALLSVPAGEVNAPNYLWFGDGTNYVNGEVFIRRLTIGSISSPPQGTPGDLNEDGVVDAPDFALFTGCMAGPQLPNPGCDAAIFSRADLDDDDDVDMSDFGAFQIRFGQSCP